MKKILLLSILTTISLPLLAETYLVVLSPKNLAVKPAEESAEQTPPPPYVWGLRYNPLGAGGTYTMAPDDDLEGQACSTEGETRTFRYTYCTSGASSSVNSKTPEGQENCTFYQAYNYTQACVVNNN